MDRAPVDAVRPSLARWTVAVACVTLPRPSRERRVHGWSRSVRRAVAVAVGIGLAAGCATGGATTPTRRTLTVAMAEDWASAPTVRAVIDRFEADHEGVRVQVTDAPFSQIPAVVRNAAELGQPYDLAHWHAFAAGAAGLAEDVGDLWTEAGLDEADYVDGAVQGVTWDGRRYGVPLDVNALVLLADGDALRAADVTEDDLGDPARFVDVADQLVAGGSRYAMVVTASSWVAYGWIRAFGGDLVTVDEDGEVVFTFDDPRTVAALDMLAEMVDDGTSPAPYAPDLSLDAVEALTDGTVALHTSGSWDLPITRRAVDPGIDVDAVEVLPMPGATEDAGTVLGGSSLFVPVGGDRELAFELMLALTADDVALELVETEGRLPAARHLYDGAPFSDDEGYRRFADQLDRADVMRLLAYPQLEVAFGEALEAVLRLEAPADEALAAVQELALTGGAVTRPVAGGG